MVKRGRKKKVERTVAGGEATAAEVKGEAASFSPTSGATLVKVEPELVRNESSPSASAATAPPAVGATALKGEPAVKAEPIAAKEEQVFSKAEDKLNPIASHPDLKTEGKKLALSNDEKVEQEADFLPMSKQALELLASDSSDEAIINEYGEMTGFQENGNRYAIELAKSNRASCKGKCKQTIKKGSVKFGSSKDVVFYGHFFYRHLECVTYRQLKNIARTYGTEEYSVIPGWHLLTPEQKVDTTEMFEMLREEGIENDAEKEAKKAVKNERAAVREMRKELTRERMEKFDQNPECWKTFECLENEPVAFLNSICRFLYLKEGGVKAKIVSRIGDHRLLLETGNASVKSDVVKPGPGSQGKKKKKAVSRKRVKEVEDSDEDEDELDWKAMDIGDDDDDEDDDGDGGDEDDEEDEQVPKKKKAKSSTFAAVRRESSVKASQSLSRAERAARRAAR